MSEGLRDGEWAFETDGLTKRFGKTTALEEVSVRVPHGSVVGLVGRNGAGKTTLLQHVVGLRLPTSGRCVTLGREAKELGRREFTRIGMVHQEARFLGWMRVSQQIRYIAAFHPSWDTELERRLVRELEVDVKARIATLSPGNAQKLSLLVGVCHRPDLLLLDEPVNALDPIAREGMLRLLLELVREGTRTIVVSSHILHDIEAVVDRILCLDRGRLRAWSPLDDLLERYAEWRVRAGASDLPAQYTEPYVLAQQNSTRAAQLLVRDGEPEMEAFRRRYGADVEKVAVNLERVFPHLIEAA